MGGACGLARLGENGLDMALARTWTFFRHYLGAPDVVGAVAPSSRGLGRALAAPFAARTSPARVLEVGAGTGAVTRVIAELMGDDDRLDICEIQPRFADAIQRDLIDAGPLHNSHRDGRVRLLRTAIQNVIEPGAYDYVICGLPFTAFSIDDVTEILDVIKGNLRPGGTFSYFEYVFLRRLGCAFSTGERRKQVRAVSTRMDQLITAHQVARQTIWTNIPPAYARHIRFE